MKEWSSLIMYLCLYKKLIFITFLTINSSPAHHTQIKHIPLNFISLVVQLKHLLSKVDKNFLSKIKVAPIFLKSNWHYFHSLQIFNDHDRVHN